MKRLKLNSITIVALSTLTAISSAEESKNAIEDPENKIQKIERITITGFKSQIRGGIAKKFDATGIADFLVGDEFGKQPDLNLADSLRRLPGVSTIFDEDEGRFVSIRGLPSRYTTVALNGAIIPDSWQSMTRGQNIEAIPSFAVKSAGVYKSLTSDLDGNSIGGYINNTLVSAFDHDGFKLISDVRLGYHSNMSTPGGGSNPSPKVQILISDTFGNDNRFGYVLSGSYFEKSRDQSKSERIVSYDDDIPYISQARAVDYSNTITRYSMLGRLEFLGDNFTTALSASYFDYQYDELRYTTRIYGKGTRSSTAEAGSFSEGSGELILDRFPLGTETSFLMWDLQYNVNDSSELTANVTLSKARYDSAEDAVSINFTSENTTTLGYSYDLTQQDLSNAELVPIVYNDSSALVNVDNYHFSGDFFPRAEEKGQNIDQAKIDYAIDLDELSFKVGVSVRYFEAYAETDRPNYYSPVDEIPSASSFVVNNRYNAGLGVTLASLDRDLFLNYFYSNPDKFTSDLAKGIDNSLKFDVSYQEDIIATYALTSYLGSKYKITAGLRYENTDFESFGRNNSDSNAIVVRTNDYSNLLPSVIGHYDVNDNLRLRAGFHESIGRPEPADVSRRESVSVDSGGDININRGNPDLKPRQSNNYDVALDYTIADGEFVSVAYFYKDIKDEIFTFKDESDVVNELGQTVRQIITQPTNLSKVNVQGIEFTLVNDLFESMPAPWNSFGFTSNFTWLDANLNVPQSTTDLTDTRKIDQLNDSQQFKVNASLLFEYDDFDAKLTYASHDKRRDTTSTSNANSDRFTERYDQIDIFGRYYITDNLNIFVEGRNITNEKRITSYGSGIGLKRNDFGKSYWLGISYKL